MRQDWRMGKLETQTNFGRNTEVKDSYGDVGVDAE